ncbi:helix-hairpin-helix domain-containing protein [Sphingomonas hankookensis]|uniref:helix-hairpin-helix domain-containing protein n=1 Tax=Sphingomonas hankookensis TaxID=563996 RepID=UPI003F7920B9
MRELEDSGHLERSGETPAGDPDAPADTVPVERAAEIRAGRPARPRSGAAAGRPARARGGTGSATGACPAPPAVPAGETDLTRLKGLGPKVAAMLVEQGIADIAALARLDPAQADAVAGRLGMFAPRMARDRWVEQARLLAAGDVAGFEARFGKL